METYTPQKYRLTIAPIIAIIIIIGYLIFLSTSKRLQISWDLNLVGLIIGIAIIIDGLVLFFYKEYLWEIFEALPILYHGIALLVATFIAFLPTELISVILKSEHWSLIASLGISSFFLLNFLQICIFTISWQQSITIEYSDYGLVANYAETAMIFPYPLVKRMKFVPNTDGELRFLIDEVKQISLTMLQLSRIGYVRSYSEEEFSEDEVDHSYFLRIYDPETNPKIENAVLLWESSKEGILKLFKLLREFGKILVVKQDDTIVESSSYGLFTRTEVLSS